jgi:predicted O-methyltransferase YrrM
VVEQTGSVHHEVMQRIHGSDVYAGFVPMFPEDRQGWNSQHPVFDQIIRAIRPGIVVDVGVWKGASTIYLAELMKSTGIAGTVIAVDTFLGSVEHWDRNSGFAALIPRRFGMPLLYDQFLSNVVRCGAQDRVVPLPQTSTTASLLLRRVGVQAGLIHIDASHEYEDVLRDARAYWDILAPGGFLVGDDYDQYWPGVVQAANQFATEKGLQLMTSTPKWIVRKPV